MSILKTLICAALLSIVMGTCLAAVPCAQGIVSVNPAHTFVTLRVTFPKGVDEIQLDSYHGYQRSQLWRSPADSAQMRDDAITVHHRGRRIVTLRMDVTHNLRRPDRTYRPFLRFGDGTIAVYSGNFTTSASSAASLCLRYAAAPGEDVIGYGQVSHDAITAPHASGYVAFGRPRVLHAPV